MFHAMLWGALEPLVEPQRMRQVGAHLQLARVWLTRLVALVWGFEVSSTYESPEADAVLNDSIFPDVLTLCKELVLSLPRGDGTAVTDQTTVYNLRNLAAVLAGSVSRLGDLLSNIFRSPTGDVRTLLEHGTRTINVDDTWNSLAMQGDRCILDELYQCPPAIPLPRRYEAPAAHTHPPAARVRDAVRPALLWDATRAVRHIAVSTGAGRGRGRTGQTSAAIARGGSARRWTDATVARPPAAVSESGDALAVGSAAAPNTYGRPQQAPLTATFSQRAVSSHVNQVAAYSENARGSVVRIAGIEQHATSDLMASAPSESCVAACMAACLGSDGE